MTTAGVTPDAATPAGNTYDKYGTGNPVARRLMAGFTRTVDGLLASAAPASVLDVGCGEGILTERWARRWPAAEFTGVDLDDPGLQAEWAGRQRPNLAFAVADGAALPYADGAFDCVTAIEALEHVPSPDAVLAEMCRCASRHVLVSVPREPLWRALNLARGAYWREAGNTPGHLNHWSRRSFARLLGRHGEVVAVRSPAPWTVVLIRV
ncbi:MAG: class I SAM-dependent methyltransferase [Solirubrobacteraceae bacterium]